jgi:glycosyltransferase involved in cell wall biosynthesis
METIPLSVAIITKNEEANIEACLQSVIFARQIVVVDSGSTDKTLAIVEEFGCDIYREGWHGFGAQKQLAIDKCTQPWILVLDADERIPPETAAVIKSIVTSPDAAAAGFTFPRKNYFQGRWIKHAGWWPDRILRLFKKGSGGMTKAAVHEAVEVQCEIKNLDTPIEHYTESNLSNILLKIDRYSTLGAREAFAAGKRSSPQAAFFRALFTFLQDYFLRGGLLDGKQGLTLAVTDSVNKYFKYAKLSQLENTNQKSSA